MSIVVCHQESRKKILLKDPEVPKSNAANYGWKKLLTSLLELKAANPASSQKARLPNWILNLIKVIMCTQS